MKGTIKMGYFNVKENEKDGANRPKHIRGVSCDVKSCAYHDGESFCTADRINVGPSYATASTDTACVSFKPKAIR